MHVHLDSVLRTSHLRQSHCFVHPNQTYTQMASDHIHNSLPPVLTEGTLIFKDSMSECYCISKTISTEETTIVGLGARWGDQGVEDGITLTADTRVKLIRYGAVRYTVIIFLYHTMFLLHTLPSHEQTGH